MFLYIFKVKNKFIIYKLKRYLRIKQKCVKNGFRVRYYYQNFQCALKFILNVFKVQK